MISAENFPAQVRQIVSKVLFLFHPQKPAVESVPAPPAAEPVHTTYIDGKPDDWQLQNARNFARMLQKGDSPITLFDDTVSEEHQ